MWGERKRRKRVSKHQSPEQRLEANEQFATFEDLDGLTEQALYEIAIQCDEEPALPEECVPCKAFVLWHEIRQAAALKDAKEDEEEPFRPAISVDHPPASGEPAIQNISDVPVVERFASQVRVLSLLVEEMLHGDPIPPPEITIEEVAALTVGSKKWLAMLEAQGLTLSTEQEQVREAVRAAVAKVQRG